jgi:hypothetical protein
MRKYPFPLAAVLALAVTYGSHAAGNPHPAQASESPTRNHEKKVWTNDDMAGLRARGLISIVGQEPEAAPASEQAALTATQPSFPFYESRLDDPEWYAGTAADLQAELDQAEADLQQQQAAMVEAKRRVTQPGVALTEPSLGVTPDAALAILQARVAEIQNELDELADLARQHDIPPGDLRS